MTPLEPLLRELLGEALRRRRRAQGRTLADVAAQAGMSMQHLSDVERGRKDPSSEMVAAICGALDLTLGQLMSLAGATEAGRTDRAVAPVIQIGRASCREGVWVEGGAATERQGLAGGKVGG